MTEKREKTLALILLCLLFAWGCAGLPERKGVVTRKGLPLTLVGPALKRCFSSAGVDRVKTLSGYKETTFAKAYGLYIKELGLFARAVIVLDREGKIRYLGVVPDLVRETEYENALAKVKDLL